MATWPRAFARFCCAAGFAILVLPGLNARPALAQSTTQSQATAKLSAAQLEQLVAPIALYPDPLLSQVFMASTYPLEVVSAARWSQANPSVTGDALEKAMQQQTWDPSVKALTAIPQTLQMMSDKLDWTQQLGDAFLAQQSEVLDAVQNLRARADANGQLKSTSEQSVTKTSRSTSGSHAGPATVYAIEPTNPDEYYVPVYDPGVVYGAWPYPDYAPFYWYPPGYPYYGTAFSFAAGVLVGSAIWGNVDWIGNRLQVNAVRYNSFNRTNIGNNINWGHDPAHRGGVPYRDAGVSQRFGNQGQNAAREGFRNQADIGRKDLAKGEAKNSVKGTAGNRAADVNRAANVKGAGNKAGNLKGSAGSDKVGAGPKANDLKKTAGNKTGNKNGAGDKQAGTKSAAQNKQAANRSSGNHNVSRSSNQSTGSRDAGMQSRAQSAGGGRGGGGGGRGAGRRSDVRLKQDIVLLGYLSNGLGSYRFNHNGSERLVSA